MKRNKVWPPMIMGKSETLDYINKTGCSIGRYGDGEVSLMAMIGIGFQRPSWKLRKELIGIAKSDDPGFLVCIPVILIDKSELVPSSVRWWTANLRLMGYVWKHYFSTGRRFGDTQITRPWLNTQNHSLATMCFSGLEKEWAGKDIILIEGEKSRVGVGNDFFKAAKSVKRILCPVRNAYSKIDEIYDAAVTFPKTSVFLLALGPTATVLSYRLYKAGFRALDIGHMDIEYEWFLMKADHKVPIKSKYVNEAGGEKVFVDSVIDEEYRKEIVCVIK